MPLRISRGLIHVSKAPALGGGQLPWRIFSMTKDDAKWWDEHVQKPFIDAMPGRADSGWNWPWKIFNLTRLAAEALSQQPVAFVAGVECASPPMFLPCVMNLLVETYADLADSRLESVFLWYLSPAPEEFFRSGRGRILGAVPKALMAIGMDMTITHSYNVMRQGRVGLHAAPKGGKELFDWYTDPARGGMHAIPKRQRLAGGWRRNDGRYFYHDETTALTVSRRLDSLR
jgi:hypothetical protein